MLRSDHVRLAIPPGAETLCSRFHATDPVGNRLEFVACADPAEM